MVNDALTTLLDLKISMTVPGATPSRAVSPPPRPWLSVADGTAWQWQTLVGVQIFADAQHDVHALAACDVLGEAQPSDNAAVPWIEPTDAYTVYIPSDPTRVPIRIVVTKAPHELPVRLTVCGDERSAYYFSSIGFS